ncbi:MAG: hypothetical protein WC724_03755 [Candidatus Paceibacterota bacterium]|jgi:hypothetical protein
MVNTFVKKDGNFTRTLPPTNLNEYYQSQGRTLPSVSERATAYGDQNYRGTTEQNTAQLQRLLNPTPTTTATQTPPPAPPQSQPVTTEKPVTDNPYDAFNELLQISLKKAQSVNSTDLLKQQRELQRQRIAKMQGSVSATPEEARFLSPSQQSAIRGADVKPIETAIDAVQYDIETANQTRKDLIEQIMFARDSGNKARESALEAEYKKADQELKKKQLTLDEAKLTETIRGNKASEDIARNKASDVTEGGYNEKQNKIITTLNDKISKNATYASTVSMAKYGNGVKAALSQRTGVGDIAAINQFQKVIDEGAVTRDQDVILIQSAQSLMNSLQTKIKGLTKGEKLSEEQRTQINSILDSMYVSQVKALEKDPYIMAKTKELQNSNIDPKDSIIGELGAFSGEEPKTIEDYRAEFPQATTEELKALMAEEQQ